MYQGRFRPPRKYSLRLFFLLRPKYSPTEIVRINKLIRTMMSKALRIMLFAFGGEEIAYDLAAFFSEHTGDDLGFRMQGTSM